MSSPSLIGTTLGAYAVQALLGQGGMATVYQGFDPQLQRPVAIKLLAPALAADPAYVARFRQEARLIANLRHPHIAQVYAFGEHGGAPYMVQELLAGPTLEQRLKDLAARGAPMPQREVQDAIAQLAGALDAAHAVGVIHRDVKPGNAILNAQGQVVLTDFGIARAADASRTATAAGVIIGTPSYMAPEQALGSAALTPACDVYALGVVLFELLTGRLPFEAATAMGVVMQHLNDLPPAPSSLRPGLPPALDALVLRALAKEPAERFASAGELARALLAAWPLGFGPAAGPAAPGLHEQQTSVWVHPNAGGRHSAATTPVQPAPVGTQPPAAAPISAGTPAPAAPPARPRLLLPLALLLAAALGAGALWTFRGGSSADNDSALARATLPATPGDTAPASPAAASPTEVTEPAATPAALPAEATSPAAPPAPTAEAPAPAPSSDPLAELRAIVQDERIYSKNDAARDLPRRVEEVARALTAGDLNRAATQLRDLRVRVAEFARDRKIAQDAAVQATAAIDRVASQYQLDLTPDGPGKPGKPGDKPGKDEDKPGKPGKGKAP